MSQQSGWQLAGTGPESYERHNVVAFMETARDLVTLAALQNGERVLDVACGTGVLARLAAKAVGPTGKVAGADLNEGMLNMARAKAEQESSPIEYRLCDAAALTFPDGIFDVALCQWGLEFFSDRSQALRQIARVLVPGGRLVTEGLHDEFGFGYQNGKRRLSCQFSRYRSGNYLSTALVHIFLTFASFANAGPHLARRLRLISYFQDARGHAKRRGRHMPMSLIILLPGRSPPNWGAPLLCVAWIRK